jgi:hypothetical protein
MPNTTLTHYPCGRSSQGRRLWKETDNFKTLCFGGNKMTQIILCCVRAHRWDCVWDEGRSTIRDRLWEKYQMSNFYSISRCFLPPNKRRRDANFSKSTPAWICWQNLRNLTWSSYLCPTVIFSSCNTSLFRLVSSLPARCDVTVLAASDPTTQHEVPTAIQSRSALLGRHPYVQYISHNDRSSYRVEWTN